jgi:hypothetical protein
MNQIKITVVSTTLKLNRIEASLHSAIRIIKVKMVSMRATKQAKAAGNHKYLSLL